MSPTSLSPLEASLQSIVRSYLESVALDKRSRALADMLIAADFDEMLHSKREWRSDDFGEVWRQWLAVKRGLSEEQLTSLWRDRWSVLGPLFDESIDAVVTHHVDQARKNFELAQPAEIQELRLKLQRHETSRGSQNRRLINRAYVVALVAIVVLVGIAVRKGWSQSPEVTVDFNVGEIIGGILVGAGAMTAGAAYALKGTGPREE